MVLVAAARAIEGAIARAARAAVVGLGLAIFALMLAGIAGRHVFSRGLPAVTELPEQLFPWFVMASVVLAAHAGAHVAVEYLALRAGPAWRRRLAVLAELATVVLSATVVWAIAKVALIAGGDRSPILGIPTLHFYLALGGGFALMGVLAFCALARLAAGEPPRASALAGDGA
jgi:TRAP-type C4-dicarboxylate transport system permease small subunit